MVAESAIKIARAQQQKVMVSNVDSDAQRDAWRRLLVDFVQGAAIAKPSPVWFQLPR
jgi:EAL domain-containing protein (putative c-di-GMP-specific phosphodiesterase class I)